MYGDIPSRGWDDYYPLGTWSGDPRAPWNEPEPGEGHTCGECLYFAECKYLDGQFSEICAFEIECGGNINCVSHDSNACEGFTDFGRRYSSNEPCGDSCSACPYAVDCVIGGRPTTVCVSDMDAIVEVDKLNGTCDDYA